MHTSIHTHTHTDIETYRHTHVDLYRQTSDIQTDRQTYRHSHIILTREAHMSETETGAVARARNGGLCLNSFGTCDVDQYHVDMLQI